MLRGERLELLCACEPGESLLNGLPQFRDVRSGEVVSVHLCAQGFEIRLSRGGSPGRYRSLARAARIQQTQSELECSGECLQKGAVVLGSIFEVMLQANDRVEPLT